MALDEEGQFLYQGSGGGMSVSVMPHPGDCPEASTEVKGPRNWVEGQGHMLRSSQKLQPTKAHLCFHPPLSQLSPTLSVGSWEAMPEDGARMHIAPGPAPGPEHSDQHGLPSTWMSSSGAFIRDGATRETSAQKGNLLLYHSPISNNVCETPSVRHGPLGHHLLLSRRRTPPIVILPFVWCLLFLSLAAQTPSTALLPRGPDASFLYIMMLILFFLLLFAFLNFVDMSDHSSLSLPISSSSGFVPISILSLTFRGVSDRKQR